MVGGSPWESMMPGPPGKSNGGAADISTAGLLALAAGSSISVVDTRSMQLVTAIPLPPPSSSSSSLSPFVTAVRWAPYSLLRQIDIISATADDHHLLLAAGDRQGRLSLLDLRSRSPILWFDTPSKLGIQDICWIQSAMDSWTIAAIHGPHLLSLYSAATGSCFFQYDAGSEFLSCVRRNPFDSRQFCVLGLKGLLLVIKVLGENENDVVVQELRVGTDSTELGKMEVDLNGSNSIGSSPVSAIFPNYPAKCAFSNEWRHILFVSFPRELVVFDLQYGTALFRATLPRGGRFLDVLPDPNTHLLYCLHIDGKLSTWKRRQGEQTYTMCATQELMPSIGNSVPPPSILATVLSQADCALQDVGRIYSDVPHSPFSEEDFDNPFDFCDESLPASKTHLISISDDGKIWNWLLISDGLDDAPKDTTKLKVASTNNGSQSSETSIDRDASERSVTIQSGRVKGRERSSNLNVFPEGVVFKIILVGQLHLLSSTVTTLAVPSPSLMATVARGGNHPAATVPLVALGTQSGTIEIIDVCTNAVAACFAVHSGPVRGLRWLGNS